MMIVENSTYCIEMTVTGNNREDCIEQIQQIYGPPPQEEAPRKKVALSKIELIKAIFDYSKENGYEGGLQRIKFFVERNYPQFDQP
jgi:hypothetical protein